MPNDPENILDLVPDAPPATTPRPVRVGKRPRTKPGVRLGGVSPELVSFASDRDYTITSGRDAAGVHVRGSLHGSGNALDLRVHDKSPAAIRGLLVEAHAAGYGAKLEHKGEGKATGDHIHLSKVKGGGQRPPPRPKSADEENVLDQIPDVDEENVLSQVPDSPPEVSRATPQVTSQLQVPSQAAPPAPPPSAAPGRPEIPAPSPLPPPGARESAPLAPTPPAAIPQLSTTPQPATAGVETEPEGVKTDNTPSVNFPRLDQPGYADALSELIKSRGLADTRQLDDYLKWIEQASAHGDLQDPAFRAQIVSGHLQGPPVVRSLSRPGAATPAPSGAAPSPPPAPATMTGPPAAELPVATPVAPERPVIEGGAIRVPAPTDATAESLIYRAFYDLAKSSGRLSDALADQYARQVAQEDMAGGEEFAARARAAGEAAVGVRPENLHLLQQYAEGAQSGVNIEAQMTADTGVIQSSTDEQRRREAGLREKAEKEVAAEQEAQDQLAPELQAFATPEQRTSEVQGRVAERTNQLMATSLIHDELSNLVIDRSRLKEEMRAAVEAEYLETETNPASGKARQEYAAGMAGMLPGARMRQIDREAEDRTQSLIDDIQYAKESTDPVAAVGVVQSIFQRFRKNPLVLIPVVSKLVDLQNTLDVRAASQRIEVARTEGRAPEQRDALTLQAHQAAEHTNKTFWASVGDIVVEQVAFAGEFYLTGPAAGAVEGAVGRGLARVGIRGLEEGAEVGAGALRSRLASRVLGEEALAGAGGLSLAERSAYKVGEIVSKMVQTTVSGGMRTATVGAPHIAEEYVERRMKGEDGAAAFLHSVLDQAGEYISESQGDVLELLPGMKRLDDALRPVMSKMEAAGYHGVIGEIYEERWKDLYDVVTGLKTWEEVKAKWEDPRNWGVEAVGFALPGVGRAAAGHAGAALGQMRAEFAGKLDALTSRIAGLSAEPPTEETAAELTDAEEELKHYTGLVEEIDAHEREVAARDAESATAAGAADVTPAPLPEEKETGAAAAPLPEPSQDQGSAESQAVGGLLGEQKEAPSAYEPPATGSTYRRNSDGEVVRVRRSNSVGVVVADARDERHVVSADDFVRDYVRTVDAAPASVGATDSAPSAEGQTDEHGFRQFPAERGSLGVPRSQMPQIKSENRGALVNYLEARGIEHEEMMVRPSSLRPTQAEYSPEKVQKAREHEGGNRAILVSGDGYVLDGQHQLEQAREDAPETPYRVIVLHGDAKDLLPLLHDFPSSTVNKESEGGPKEAPTTAESFADEIMGELTGAEAETPSPDSDYPTAVVDVIRSPEHPGNVRQAGDGAESSAVTPEEEELYRRAVETTRDTGRLSTSHLQRTLKIGYGAASRLVQRMRDDGTAARYGIVDAHVAPAGQGEAAPSSSGERGLGHAELDTGETIAQSPAAGESPNMSTPVKQATGVVPDRAVRREGRDYIAPDGRRFTGAGAKAGAETHARQMSYVGATVRSYDGSLDTVSQVEPLEDERGIYHYRYHVTGETGERRSHQTQITDDEVVRYAAAPSAVPPEQRAEIRARREAVKTKLAEAHRKRLAASGAVEPGSELRHSGPALPSREEVVLTAELLLTYAQEGTLLFKEAARRFAEDVGSTEYARELSKAFEAGWRLLKKKGFEVDEAGALAEHVTEEEDERNKHENGGGGHKGGAGEESEAAAGEGREAPPEEDTYLPPDPLEAQPDDPPRVSLGRHFARAFIDGQGFATVTKARKFAESKLGRKIESGTQAAKDVDEAIEIGVGIAAREIVRVQRAEGQDDTTIYRHLVHLYTEQQPNLSVRTSTSAIDQAYSTPAPLAFVASRLAGINRRTTVLENSAGNGMLAIEAAPEALTLNEKNSARFAALEALFPLADVRQGDALALDLGAKVDRFIANPPFSNIKDDKTGDSKTFEPLPGYQTTQLDHAIAFAGLGEMSDTGRAVLIVGSVRNEDDRKSRADQYDAKAKRLFYYHLYRNYNVVDHFTVGGKPFERQGASVPVDVIVIDGRGKSSRKLPAADPPRVYKTWDDLAEVLKNGAVQESEVSGVDAGDRPAGASGTARGGGADTGGAGVAGRGDVSDVSGRPGADDAGAGARPETGAPRTGASPGVGGDARGHAADEQSERGGTGDRVGQPGASDEAVQPGRAGGQVAEEDSRRQPGREETRRGDEPVGVGEHGSRPAAQRAKVDISKSQISYAPASRGRGMKTLTPVNMATAAQDALDALIKRLGGVRGDDTLDRFVADRLGWTLEELLGTEESPGRLGAEQVDAVALAIDNIEHGSAMILGDQPGIGKGRPVATVLEYASRLGKTPIFVTEKPGLYKDIVRDLVDIGAGTLEELRDAILMTNASEDVTLNEDLENPVKLRTPDAKEHNAALAAVAVAGRLPEGKHYIFTTYSQMQKIGGETARQRFLRDMSGGAVIVFDESHNAGGTENAGWGKKSSEGAPQHDPLSRAGFAREVIDLARGVFYSSGTFAKRASVMDLYSKTDMRLSVSNVPLAEMIAKGGVPLQQIVSSMLVESGQMLRRERSFEGIEYATAVAPVDQESAETVASVMRTVFEFDKVKKSIVGGIKERVRENAEAIGVDPATGAASASSTAFSSLIHNLVDQMLLSLKMEAAVEHALTSLRAGEKPVITVAFTFGSFLESYAKEFHIQPGEAVGLNFGDMLKRYLERTRDVTYKRPDNTTYRLRLTDEQLGPKGVALYDEAAGQIQGADWSKMPVSPLDYIKYRIESEIDPKTGRNYKVGEITGRTYALDYSEHFRTKGEAPPVFRRRVQGEKNTKGRIAQIVGFNEGSLDAMLLNQAGNSGLSLHASERVSDRRPRHMIVAQPERNIDTHFQLLFRINRTGQVVLPRYTQLVADIPSEKRPAAVLAKKMASLNANTTAARGSKFKAESVVDFMNQYGDQVAFALMENNPALHERLGEPLATADGMDSEDAARRVTGRLPILTIAEATAVYDELEQEYNDLIERLNALGENALEAQTLALDARTQKQTPVFEGTGTRPFERGAVAEDVDVKRLRKPYDSATVVYLVRQSLTKRLAELKAVEAVPEGGDLRQLAQVGEYFQDYQREAVTREIEEYQDYLTEALRSIIVRARKGESQEEANSRDEQGRRMTETRVKEALRRWKETHARYRIGQTVMVTSGQTGELYGVITDIYRGGRTANPAALSAWKLQVALADAARSVNIPFSQLRLAGGTDGDALTMEDTTAGSRYTVQEADEASVFDHSILKRVTVPVLEAFDRGQSASRERRVIITGNLLAGFGRFEKARGQIINFTDDQGNLRQGILMPKDFDVQKALDAEPIVFKDASQVVQFLQSTPGLVTTPDGHFKIVKQGANDFKFTAPKARGVGQKYWGNTALLEAAGRDFVTKGDYMTLVTRADVGQEVIAAALLQGWTLQTNTHKERAREITRTKQKGGAAAAGYASPRREGGDRESSRASGRPSLTAQLEPEADVESFQVSQRVRDILRRLHLPSAERSISNRLLGIFKLRERKVRVQSLFDVFTVAHEGMHGISVAEEIGERLIGDTKRGATLRDRLTDIYEEFYPRAKRTHALKTRVEEGLAVLAERYLLDPGDTRARYGDLVATFIAPAGKYYSARTAQLLDEMAALVGDYAKMSAAQRIGARVASGKEVVERDAGYSVVERLEKNLLNKMEPLRRYAKREGVIYTSADPMASYFGVLSRPALVHGWIEGRKMAVLRPDGSYELRDGSVKTYLRQIKGREKEFDTFLVARRVVADHNRRAELLAEAADPLTGPERAAEAVAEAEEVRQVLENDDFSLQDALQVVTDAADDFKEPVQTYDAVNRALAEFAENAGLITPGYARELKTSRGYAAFVRKVYDENQSDYAATHGSMNPQTKVRTFKTRKGSTLDIVSPVYTQITSVGEVLGKGLQNRLWSQVLRLADDSPEIARRFEVIPTETAMREGRATYPQMRDPKLIHVLVAGRHTFVKPAQEFADVAAHLRPQELDLFAKWIKAPSSFFTRLTTSANPVWAMGNITIDQFTAWMNTQTGFKPIYDPAKSLVHYVEWLTKSAVGWTTEKVTGTRKELNLPHTETVERYMELGGKKQTFASQYELSPEDAVARVLGGRTLYQHVAHVFEMGLSLLEFPSNLSEYLTRYSEFRRSLAGGDTDEVAMYKAAEVTVAFQQRGAWAGKMGENWISTLPYFNALVQVNYKFLRNAREQPGRTAAVVAALMVSALGGALALLRWLDDDDEARRLFMNLPARELARAIYLPNPLNKGSLIRIRVPEQVGAITGIMYLYAIQHYGGQKVKRDELFQALASPLPEQADVTDARKMLIAWLPQAVRPSVNAYANRKTYPEVGPIVPKRLEDMKAAELQFNDYTSAVGKQMGALLNVSPMKIDYWIRNQFGAVGGALLGQMPSFPLVRTAREYEVAERAYDNFYAQKEAADAQMERLKATSEGRRAGAYSEGERREIIEAATLYEKMGKVLANVRKAQGVRPLPAELKREVYETLLFFDTSADIVQRADRIEKLNAATLKYAADSGAKIDHSKAVATPEGMERVTRESVIDLNISRQREIKLPPSGSK